jgi:hypothetical protein
MSAWRKTGLIPLNPQEVLSKLPNRPSTTRQSSQLQLVVNGNAPLDLLVGAGTNYVEEATQAIKDTVLGSPVKRIIDTIEHLNANNAILSKINADLVTASRAHKETKKASESRRHVFLVRTTSIGYTQSERLKTQLT